LRAEAARAHNKRTAAYLLGIPLLSDYLRRRYLCSICPAMMLK